jgi:hypothetical protein
MDYDRKSTVSSFYGDRRTSYDALNTRHDLASPTSPAHAANASNAAATRTRHDSSSSFFNPNSGLPPGAANPRPSAGYNRSSYFDTGREEPVKGSYEAAGAEEGEGWDVYADFNNAGPKYSTAFGLMNNEARCVLPLSK